MRVTENPSFPLKIHCCSASLQMKPRKLPRRAVSYICFHTPAINHLKSSPALITDETCCAYILPETALKIFCDAATYWTRHAVRIYCGRGEGDAVQRRCGNMLWGNTVQTYCDNMLRGDAVTICSKDMSIEAKNTTFKSNLVLGCSPHVLYFNPGEAP